MKKLFILGLFAVFLSVTSITYAAALPLNFGAQGALQDDTITLEEALTYAIQDEYLAQARYNSIIEKFGQIKPFVNIIEAEQRHINALLPLFEKYNIEIPKDHTQKYLDTPLTLKKAFYAGIEGEKENIAMYEKLTNISDLPDDVKLVMQQLLNTSRYHLFAFERGLNIIDSAPAVP